MLYFNGRKRTVTRIPDVDPSRLLLGPGGADVSLRKDRAGGGRDIRMDPDPSPLLLGFLVLSRPVGRETLRVPRAADLALSLHLSISRERVVGLRQTQLHHSCPFPCIAAETKMWPLR